MKKIQKIDELPRQFRSLTHKIQKNGTVVLFDFCSICAYSDKYVRKFSFETDSECHQLRCQKCKKVDTRYTIWRYDN